MPGPEIKSCPQCKAPFECRADNITECQCYGIHLTGEEQQLISMAYSDCLCRKCLVAITNES